MDSEEYKHVLMEEAETHYRAKRYEMAFEVYERAIQLDPSNTVAYVGKGNCLRKLKNCWAALFFYERAIELDPNNVSAYNGKCYAYINLEDFATALFVHEQAIKLDPQSAAAY